jgi:hypothetical protein
MDTIAALAAGVAHLSKEALAMRFEYSGIAIS